MREFVRNIIWWSIIILLLLIFISLLCLEIFCWVKYSKAPMGEIPAWAWWFMRGGKR